MKKLIMSFILRCIDKAIDRGILANMHKFARGFSTPGYCFFYGISADLNRKMERMEIEEKKSSIKQFILDCYNIFYLRPLRYLRVTRAEEKAEKEEAEKEECVLDDFDNLLLQALGQLTEKKEGATQKEIEEKMMQLDNKTYSKTILTEISEEQTN